MGVNKIESLSLVLQIWGPILWSILPPVKEGVPTPGKPQKKNFRGFKYGRTGRQDVSRLVAYQTVLELAEQPLTVGIRYMWCCPILLKPLLISAYISTSSLSVPKGPRN